MYLNILEILLPRLHSFSSKKDKNCQVFQYSKKKSLGTHNDK